MYNASCTWRVWRILYGYKGLSEDEEAEEELTLDGEYAA
jgi:hypothetical protein